MRGSGHGTEPLDPTCADYCAVVTTACTGEYAQYEDEAACLTYCETSAALPLGTSDDTSGNTVGCRMYHAGVAATDTGDGSAAGLHCPHAGPTGANVCGTWCDNYCHLAMGNCTDGDVLFESADACETVCAGYAADGEAGDAGGDSVQCRIYHLGVAGTPDGASVHCPHGAEDGGGVCVDTEEPPTYWDDVQPLFAQYCGSCHTGGGSGGHDLGTNFDDGSADSYYCPGKTKAECTIERINDGSMPIGGTVSDDDKATIQAWVDAGTPLGTPPN